MDTKEKYSFVSDCVSKLKNAEILYHEAWGCYRLEIGDKYFGLLGHDNFGNEIITLKGDPDENLLLRELYEDDIVPGFYSNKAHWNSVLLESENVPREMIEEMTIKSYDLVISKLTKKQRAEILA